MRQPFCSTAGIVLKVANGIRQVGDVGGVGRHVIVGGFELGAINGVSAASSQVASGNIGDLAGSFGAVFGAECCAIPEQGIFSRVSTSAFRVVILLAFVAISAVLVAISVVLVAILAVLSAILAVLVAISVVLVAILAVLVATSSLVSFNWEPLTASLLVSEIVPSSTLVILLVASVPCAALNAVSFHNSASCCRSYN